LNKINSLIEEYFKEEYGISLAYIKEEYGISVELWTMRSKPYDPIPDVHQYIAMKLTAKADKAIHIPHIEKMVPIMEAIQVIVQKKLLAL
jgi:hypothetical protein